MTTSGAGWTDTSLTDTLLESNKPTLAALAKQRLPIVVPWHPEQVIYPGQLFHSRLYQTSDPWSQASPFDSQVDPGQIVYLSADGGTSGSFRSSTTQTTTGKVDHESFGFTATVDLGFCSASASLSYDRHLATNNDDVKTSLRASYRCGSVLLRQAPALSRDAKITLKYDGGIDAFEQKYGDYIVIGYNLGADNQMMVSTNAHSMTLSQRVALAVKVKLLFFTIRFEQHFDSFEASSGSSVRVTGYDTLTNTTLDSSQSWSSASTVEFDRMQQESARMRMLGGMLPARVEQRAREAGLPIGSDPKGIALGARSVPRLQQSNSTSASYAPLAALETEIPRESCERLVRSGLVVELVLVPVRSLREVRYWMMEDDII